MLDIEIIKWGCEFADGFGYESETYTSMTLITPLGLKKTHHNNWKYCLYPLFLQRVIEGINKQGKTWVTQSKSWIQTPTLPKKIFSHNQCITEDFYIKDGNYDQAKEQAIKYIHNHLTKNKI